MSWAWPPIGRVGALRPLGMAREWVAAGHEVHVLTGPGDRGGEYSPDLVPAAEASGAVVHRAKAPGLDRPGSLTAAFAQDATPWAAEPARSRVRQVAAQWKTFPDGQRSWIRPAVKLAGALEETFGFDIVWSTSPPESVHFVARALARRGVSWVADFRDPWSDYFLARWDPLSRWVIDWVSRRVLASAFAVTANTRGIGTSLERATGRAVTWVPNGYDPVETPIPEWRARTLGYFGRLDSRTQRLDRVFDALRLLLRQGHPWTLTLYLTPGGAGGAVPEVPLDLSASVEVNRPLPHPEALRRMAAMNALLVVVPEAYHGERVLPGKTFEYLGSGRPILVCAPSGADARDLVESTGTGLGAWTSAELATALAHMEVFRPSPSGRAALARSRLAEQLVTVFETARRAKP